jgi:hypothetical protein
MCAARWTAPRPLQGEVQVPPSCPHCKAPLRGVFRYGRAVNAAVLGLVERKFQHSSRHKLLEAQEQCRVGAGGRRLLACRLVPWLIDAALHLEPQLVKVPAAIQLVP